MRFKIKLLPVFVVLIFISNSCLQRILEEGDCSECYSSRPDMIEAEIKLTINYKYREVPITIYEGNIEDDEVIFNDTVNYAPFYYRVPVGEKISIKAEYKWNDITIFAVDGTKIKVNKYEDCEEACYMVDNDILDVRIKSEFP